MLQWDEARHIIETVRGEAGDDPEANRLVRGWCLAAAPMRFSPRPSGKGG